MLQGVRNLGTDPGVLLFLVLVRRCDGSDWSEHGNTLLAASVLLGRRPGVSCKPKLSVIMFRVVVC